MQKNSSPYIMQLQAEDKRYIWHPFTQMRDWIQEKPLVIERGRNNLLVDVEGNE